MQKKTKQSTNRLKKGVKFLPLVLCLLVFIFLLPGCGGSKSAKNTGNIDISIEYPTSGSDFITAESLLQIAGTASAGNGISSITWSANTDQKGVAIGKTTWSAEIPLEIGPNETTVTEITVTAKGATGKTATDVLTVTYTTVSHQISGTIAAAENVRVDSDVNDVNEVYISNDTFQQAQEISPPAIIGGFVNVALAGEEAGRSYLSGDPEDFFRVLLRDGDEITLIVGESQTAKLELYLYDENKKIVDAFVVTGSTESLTVDNGSGSYFIEVRAINGASNYTLSVGIQGKISTDNVSSASTGRVSGSPLKLSDDFVPDQVMIKFKETSGFSAQALHVRERVRSLGLSTTSEGGTGLVLAKLDWDQKETAFRNMGIAASSSTDQFKNVRSARKMDTLRMIKALRTQTDVQYAEPNYIVRISKVPQDTHYPIQWNLPMIHLPDAWEITTGSSDVVVAVVDTGILMGHPDLQGRLTDDGYDFISDPQISMDGDGIDNNPEDPGDLIYGTYSSFHGTHCTGIVAAASNNNQGVSGVSWNTRIMPIRALGKGGAGTTYDVLQGVLYAAGLANDSGTVPVQPADIISLSLGGGGYLDAVQEDLDQVREKGIIVVAAAGNEGKGSSDYPAAYEGVLSVSAVDITGELADYSNYGNHIDVAAPGGDGTTDINGDGYPDGVMSTCGDDRYESLSYTYSPKSGTSMATPHVAGVVALMKAVNPGLTPLELDLYLQNFDIVTDAGLPGWDVEFGYGIIDAYKAVQVAAGGVTDATLKVTPEAFNLGYSQSRITLLAEKIGDETLSVAVADITVDAAWLSVVPDILDDDGLGTYEVYVDRTGLADGFYSATITFNVEKNTGDVETIDVSVRASMQVHNTGTVTPDSGYHYVLLVTADTLDTVMVDEVYAEDGYYHYTFENVPDNGHYQIFAGTDRDRDLIINNYGECFGVYGSVNKPAEIVVTDNLTDLDFNTELNVSFTAESQSIEITPAFYGNPASLPSLQ